MSPIRPIALFVLLAIFLASHTSTTAQPTSDWHYLGGTDTTNIPPTHPATHG